MNNGETGVWNVGVGVIGLGEHANRSHLDYLTKMPELCTVTAIGDISNDRIRQANEAYDMDARGFTDWQQLVQSDEVDAVFVMTPDRFHTSQLVGAVAAGKHVFCEKPLASSEAEYTDLADALAESERHGLVVSTCHPRRFDPPFITIRDYLQHRELLQETFGIVEDPGKVVGFNFGFEYHEPSKHGLHESLMFDHLNHEVDIMHFLFGPNGLHAATKHHDSETAFNVSGVRQDGITFSFVGSRKLKERIYAEAMLISFEHGQLAVGMHNGTATMHVEGQDVVTRRDNIYKTDYTKRFTAINEHFLRSVLGQEPPYITAEEMLINTKAAIDLQR